MIINYHLYRLGFPPIIVRSRGKERYYRMLSGYDRTGASSQFESHLANLVLESLNRRVTYMSAQQTTAAVDLARTLGISPNAFLNQCRRQLVPALRERGEWKISTSFRPTQQ